MILAFLLALSGPASATGVSTATAVSSATAVSTAAPAALPPEPGRASKLFLAGRSLEALKVYRALAKKSPAAAEPQLNAALLARDLGLEKESYDRLRTAARLEPRSAEVQSALGRSALDVGLSTAALAAFDAALTLAPADADARAGRAESLYRLDRSSEAASEFEKAAAGRAKPAAFDLGRARALEKLGQGREALEAYGRVLKDDPSLVEARLPLARLQARYAEADEAWKSYSRVLDVDEANAEVKKAREKLRPKLASTPEELMPVEHVGAFRPFQPLAKRKGVPVLRVGVGTDSRGRALPRKNLVFRASGPFRVSDPETGRHLLSAEGEEPWIARPAKGKKAVYELLDSSRKRRLLFRRRILIEPEESTDSLIFQELRFGEGYDWARLRDRQLRGSAEVVATAKGLYLVNRLTLEEYLYSVVPEEMPAHFPDEALKAQAVIARSYILFTMRIVKPHRRQGFDVCDGQHCQVYGGVAAEVERTRAAVDATRGRVLKFKGKVAQTPYASNCGGASVASTELSGWVPLAYLASRPDGEGPAPRTPWEMEAWIRGTPAAYCNVPSLMHPAHFRWTRIVAAADVERRLKRRSIGKLKGLRIARRSASGHVLRVTAVGTAGEWDIKREHDIRRLLAPGSLRSTLFSIDTRRDPKGRPLEFVFTGGGWGHGVGLCQYGAAGRALKGQTYDKILDHYYGGTRLEGLTAQAP